MIWRADLEKKCNYFNKVWLDYAGRTMAQEYGDGWAEGVHPDDFDRCLRIYVSSFDQRVPFEMEYRLRRHDGVYRWIFDRGVPYTDDHGEFLGYIGSCVDVTERIEAEERDRALVAEKDAHAATAKRRAELEEMNERVRASEKALRLREHRERYFAEVSQTVAEHLDTEGALEAIAQLIVPRVADFMFFDMLGDDGRLTRVKWRHVDEDRGRWFDELFAAMPDGPGHPAFRVLQARQPEFVSVVTDEWIERTAISPAHAEFLRDIGVRSLIRVPLVESDRGVGVLTLGMSDSGRGFDESDVSFCTNIASRLTSSLRNARLYAELQRAVKARDEMTSIVSHDLKDPLHTIQMAAGVLLDPEIGSETLRVQYLRMIQRSTQRMSQLLEDLLDVARADASTLEVEPKPTALPGLVGEVVEDFRLSAGELGITLSVQLPETLPLASADDRRIVQVLRNLCANSLKFTRRGGAVAVQAACEDDVIRLTVRDTGIGISKENLAHVFDRFWQANRKARASAGLGLAIAKSIVEAHGGKIWVESAEGDGTAFHLTLPVARGGSDRAETLASSQS